MNITFGRKDVWPFWDLTFSIAAASVLKPGGALPELFKIPDPKQPKPAPSHSRTYLGLSNSNFNFWVNSMSPKLKRKVTESVEPSRHDSSAKKLLRRLAWLAGASLALHLG